jgi:hypothetical protein
MSDPDERGYGPPKRRMADHRWDSIAENSKFKVIQGVISMILAPAIAILLNAVYNKIQKFDETMMQVQTYMAINDKNITELQKNVTELNATTKVMEQRSLTHEFEIRAIQGKIANRPNHP